MGGRAVGPDGLCSSEGRVDDRAEEQQRNERDKHVQFRGDVHGEAPLPRLYNLSQNAGRRRGGMWMTLFAAPAASGAQAGPLGRR